jgi:glycosyltransferase involved in cell wall biosynthesis
VRIVSLTPASLDGDSRTRKEAASFARMGHESVVVEAVRSAAPPEDVELLTLSSVGESLAPTTAGANRRGRVERLAAALGRVAGPAYFLVSFAAFNLRTARRLPKADLYWLHGYEQFPAVWLRRGRFVYDAHDVYAALHEGRDLPWRDRAVHALRDRVERACARRAAARVTTSDAMARELERRLGVPFSVVRNAQDTHLARPSASGVRAAAGVADDAFCVVMVGHHKPGAVIPPRLPDGVELVFVGARWPAGTRAVGPVPGDEVASFIAGADAAALLYVPVDANSPTQLFNGLFHAVAAGLPVLWPTGMDAVRELCERHGLGVGVDPTDPEDVERGLLELRERHDELAAAVRAAQAELSWAREEEALTDVLATVQREYR